MNIKKIAYMLLVLLFLFSCGKNKDEQQEIKSEEVSTSMEFENDDVDLFEPESIFVEKAKTVDEFVPEGWKILLRTDGDLNKDKLDDVVLIVEETDPNNFVKNDSFGPETLNLNPRVILVLFQEKDKSYTLKAKNENGFIESEHSEGNSTLIDPLADGWIEIVNNTLRIHFKYWYSAGSWSVSLVDYVFRYQNDNFELIGVEHKEFSRSTGEESTYSFNLSTGKIKTVTGENMSGEGEPKVEWLEKNYSPKPTLNSLVANEYYDIIN